VIRVPMLDNNKGEKKEKENLGSEPNYILP
jgi:hypothetical protein